MPLCGRSVEAYQETSSHATPQGTLGQSSQLAPSYCGLILAQGLELVRATQSPLKKKKIVQAGNE